MGSFSGSWRDQGIPSSGLNRQGQGWDLRNRVLQLLQAKMMALLLPGGLGRRGPLPQWKGEAVGRRSSYVFSWPNMDGCP